MRCNFRMKEFISLIQWPAPATYTLLPVYYVFIILRGVQPIYINGGRLSNKMSVLEYNSVRQYRKLQMIKLNLSDTFNKNWTTSLMF